MVLASKLPQRKKYLLSCLFRKEMSIYQVNLYFVPKSDFALLDQLFSEILRTHSFHLFNLIGWREQVILFEIDCAIFYTNLHALFCHFISWTNRVNFGKFMDNCWISCQVMADMNKVYDDLININLYYHQKGFTRVFKGCFCQLIAMIGRYLHWICLELSLLKKTKRRKQTKNKKSQTCQELLT